MRPHYLCRPGTNIRAVGHDRQPVQVDLDEVDGEDIAEYYERIAKSDLEFVSVNDYYKTWMVPEVLAKQAAHSEALGVEVDAE